MSSDKSAIELLNKMREDKNFPRFSLRMFMSVDVVGSTAHKHSGKNRFKSEDVVEVMPEGQEDAWKADPAPHWLKTFSKFYVEFEEKFQKYWELAADFNNEKPDVVNKDDPPQYWKALGDEIIFYKELHHPYEVGLTLGCFRQAIEDYRSVIRDVSPKLNLKGAAWLAGFPVNNLSVMMGADCLAISELVETDECSQTFLHHARLFRHNNHKKKNIDGVRMQHEFIGPQMDLGFRLAAKATPRRMMISADLAYMLTSPENTGRLRLPDTPEPAKQGQGQASAQSQAQVPAHPHMERVEQYIGYDGTTELKGVLSGVPYPLFWIECDTHNDLHDLKDELLGKRRPGTQVVYEYCKQFILDTHGNEDWVITPFIFNGKDNERPEFGELNDMHDKLCKKRNEYVEHVRKSITYILKRKELKKQKDRSKAKGKTEAASEIQKQSPVDLQDRFSRQFGLARGKSKRSSGEPDK